MRVTGYAGSHYSKFRNKPTIVDGIRFASIKESLRYRDLAFLQQQNLIRALKRQVRFKLEAHGMMLCTYIADFTYDEYAKGEWHPIVEDVKGMRTPIYLLKKKLMKALKGIDIRES